MEIETTKKARAFLFSGLIGAFLPLIGYVKFPEGPECRELFCRGAGAARLAAHSGRTDRLSGNFPGVFGPDDPFSLLKKNMSRGAVFDLLIVPAAFIVFRMAGNYALVNGLAASNKSIGVILLFAALYIGFGKYVRQEELQ